MYHFHGKTRIDGRKLTGHLIQNLATVPEVADGVNDHDTIMDFGT